MIVKLLSERCLVLYDIWNRRWPKLHVSKIFHDIGGCWQLLIGTCQCEWFETAVVSYGRTIRPSGNVIVKLLVLCGQEVFLVLMLIFVQIWGFWSQNQMGGGGNLNTLRKDSKPTHAVFVGCLMYPLFRASFIEIGGMACIMPASSWSSHELSLKICALKWIGNSFWILPQTACHSISK